MIWLSVMEELLGPEYPVLSVTPCGLVDDGTIRPRISRGTPGATFTPIVITGLQCNI